MSRLICALVLALSCGELCAQDTIFSKRASEMRDQLQMGCVKDGFVYTVQRIGVIEKTTTTANLRLRLYKIPLSAKELSDKQIYCCELEDGEIVHNRGTFLRWRLTSSGMFCGTQRGLDDYRSGTFTLSLKSLKPFVAKVYKDKNGNYCEEWGSYRGLQNLYGGDGLIWWGAERYWCHKLGEKEGCLPPNASGPSFQSWPKKAKGSSGIYFDFLPQEDKECLSMFILFDKEYWFCSRRKNKDRLATNMIELWENLDHNSSYLKDPKLIATDLSEPFYVLEKNGNYFFVSLSGKIYAAPRRRPKVDFQLIRRLIAELDSDTFATREVATRKLRFIGKPAFAILKEYLSKSISLEQKRRITELLGDSESPRDRYTRIIWEDVKRPVEKILFDLDKDKLYAFTKLDREKQTYFFEIEDNPRPRHFTGSTTPDVPASLPASARHFLGLARSLRNRE